MLLHQLGEDFVLALQFGLEVGDLLVLGVGSSLAAFVVAGEGRLTVLEEELLPGVEVGDGDAMFFADVGDRDLVEEVLSEQGDLLLRTKVAALPGHGWSSARVLPLTLPKASSCSDWGKTLSADQQKFIELLQRIRYGFIPRLLVRAGQPVMNPELLWHRNVKALGDNSPHRSLHAPDFALRKEIVEFFRLLAALGDAEIVDLQVRNGLPFCFDVIEKLPA
jgi:hypothetical protein